MYLIREPVGTITYELEYDPAFETLLGRLRDLRVPILRDDRQTGEIVVRYLCELKNYILWRCWSDKLLFRLRALEASKTHVDVFAIPNLWRIKIGKHEQAGDPLMIIRRLS